MNGSGELQPDGVLKFSMPRKDLNVTVQGTKVKAGLALGSWAAFHKVGSEAVLMGDLVLTEDEVSAVLPKLQEGGIEITALHNHLLGESPRIMYLHIGAVGDAVKLAQSLHAALNATKTPPPASGGPTQAQEVQQQIDVHRIEQTLGRPSKIKGGILQVTVPRANPPRIAMRGQPTNAIEIPNSMGVATAINFQPTGGGKAAVTGDFVLVGKEVNPVIRALRQNGINITALHSHMLDDMPHLFFMHFWANNDAVKLARGLRAALDETDSAKSK